MRPACACSIANIECMPRKHSVDVSMPHIQALAQHKLVVCDPGPLEPSQSCSIFQHKLKCGVLQSACRTWALLVCKECLWTAQLLRQAHMLHSNRTSETFCYGKCLLMADLLSAAECMHAGKAVRIILLQNWLPCIRLLFLQACKL